MRRCTSNAGRRLALLPFPPSHPVSGTIITGCPRIDNTHDLPNGGRSHNVATASGIKYRSQKGMEMDREERGM
jgi:hypothetical protein